MVATMSKPRKTKRKANTVEFTPEAFATLQQIKSVRRWNNKITADEAMKALKEKLERENAQHQPPQQSS